MWLFIRTRRAALFEVDTAGGENKDGGREGEKKKSYIKAQTEQSAMCCVFHFLVLELV